MVCLCVLSKWSVASSKAQRCACGQEKRRLERQAAKLAKKAAEDERNALFGAALAVGVKKRVTKLAGQEKNDEDKEEENPEEQQKLTAQEALELKQREKAEAKAASCPVIEQVTMFVEEGEKTLEDFIEEKVFNTRSAPMCVMWLWYFLSTASRGMYVSACHTASRACGQRNSRHTCQSRNICEVEGGQTAQEAGREHEKTSGRTEEEEGWQGSM
jgi:hypothetical protein